MCVDNTFFTKNEENLRGKHLEVQWRTQKMFMGGFHSVAYGGHLCLVCAVCDVTI